MRGFGVWNVAVTGGWGETRRLRRLELRGGVKLMSGKGVRRVIEAPEQRGVGLRVHLWYCFMAEDPLKLCRNARLRESNRLGGGAA